MELLSKLRLTNTFVLANQADDPGCVRALEALEELAMAAPMEAHPTLKRLDGTPVRWPSEQRSQLFSALWLARDLHHANSMLVAANSQLSDENQRLTRELKAQKPAEAANP